MKDFESYIIAEEFITMIRHLVLSSEKCSFSILFFPWILVLTNTFFFKMDVKILIFHKVMKKDKVLNKHLAVWW